MQNLELTVRINNQIITSADIQHKERERCEAACRFLHNMLKDSSYAAALNQLEIVDKTDLTQFRTALCETKLAVGLDNMIELLRPYCAEMSAEILAYPHTPGEFSVAFTEMSVENLTVEQFLGWFRTQQTPRTLMLSNPEHYIVREIVENGEHGHEVIETMGFFGRPLHFKIFFGNDSSEYPEPVAEGFPIVLFGKGIEQISGKEVGMYALHQFQPTETGFNLRLMIYFPAGFPQEMVEGHKWHLAIEFSRWLEMAYQVIHK